MIELFQQRKIHSDLENLSVSDLSISGVRNVFYGLEAISYLGPTIFELKDLTTVFSSVYC